jgi:long-subunit fatty acid transport protein
MRSSCRSDGSGHRQPLAPMSQFGAIQSWVGRVSARTRGVLAPAANAGRRVLAAFAAVSLALGTAQPALGAGFDTPILYTARHQGMGGTAIGYVDDPSAAFHNPAGLQGVHGLALIGNVSLILAHLTGSPAAPPSARSIQSSLTVAPMFLAGAAYRVQPWLSAGVALFPVASGGADYQYAVAGAQQYQVNETRIVFFELTPVISLNVPKDSIVPGELAFGIGYRMSLLDFERVQGARDNPQGLDLKLSGTDFTGIRLGMQYRPVPALSVGAVYRNRVDVTARADEGTLQGNPASDVELPFVLPAQLGGGIRGDIDRLGVAFDATYTFQSQNERSLLGATIGPNRVSVPNVFDWEDALTLRFGFEYRLGPAEEVPVRLGYIHDGRVSSRRYPSAFGTPPTATQTFTVGGGYDAGSWEMNLALALRGGSTEISPTEIAPPAECPTCGFSGDYGISATGVYVDFSTDIEL